MTTVIGVSFKRAGKMYYFDPNGMEITIGDKVIVETARGMECGEAVTSVKEVEEEEVVQPLKTVIRVATEEDLRRIEVNTRKEAEAFEIGQARIAAHKLEMKLVDVEYTFDVSKIIFYFTANGRIDFRELVKDLASIFKTRIELRQIGVRDEAKMLGGLGSCGRPICCRSFLGDFQPVSIKMAKEQNLLLNPTKISGLCGRLMCCLKYEQDNYDAVLRRVPRVGKEVITPDGRGVVSEISVVKEKIRVRLPGKEGTLEVHEFELDQVQPAPKKDAQENPEAEAPEKDEADQPAEGEKASEETQTPPAAPEESSNAETSEKREPAAEKTGEETPHRDRPPRRRGGRGGRSGHREGENSRTEKTYKPAEGGRTSGTGSNRPPRPRTGAGETGERPRGEGRNRSGNRRSEDRRPPRRTNENGGVRTLPREQRPRTDAVPSREE